MNNLTILYDKAVNILNDIKNHTGLKYNDIQIINVINGVLFECQNKGILNDIIVSKTGDYEVLIYTKYDGIYRNIIIDEDGDIEVLIIPIDRSLIHHYMFDYTNEQDYKKIVNYIINDN